MADDGHLRMESLGNDTYKITRVKENQIPLRNIQIPENIYIQIQNHINEDAVKLACQYTSVEDFVDDSIKMNIEADRDNLEMKRR